MNDHMTDWGDIAKNQIWTWLSTDMKVVQVWFHVIWSGQTVMKDIDRRNDDDDRWLWNSRTVSWMNESPRSYYATDIWNDTEFLSGKLVWHLIMTDENLQWIWDGAVPAGFDSFQTVSQVPFFLFFPTEHEADTHQGDLFDLLKEERGYVVGMFSY